MEDLMTVIIWVWHEIIDIKYKFKTRSPYTFNAIEPKLSPASMPIKQRVRGWMEEEDDGTGGEDAFWWGSVTKRRKKFLLLSSFFEAISGR